MLVRLSFSVSLPFSLLIFHTFSGCACFCAFGCSIGAPLALPYGFACLLAVRFPIGHVFLAFGYSLGSPLAFPCLFPCLFSHVCWLCMFLRIWFLGRRPFSVSLPLCLVIGRTFAGWACFCTFGCSVGTPLAIPCLFARLFSALFPVVHVSLLVAP